MSFRYAVFEKRYSVPGAGTLLETRPVMHVKQLQTERKAMIKDTTTVYNNLHIC